MLQLRMIRTKRPIDSMAKATPAGRRGCGKPCSAWLCWTHAHEHSALSGPSPNYWRNPPSLRGGILLRRLLLRSLPLVTHNVGAMPSVWTTDLEPGCPRVPWTGGRAGLRPPLINLAVGGPESAGALS